MKQLAASVLIIAGGAYACAPPSAASEIAVAPVVEDSTARGGVPAGFGSLRQDDIAIRLEPQGLIVRAIPLDESVIRLLTPDSYRALRDLEESNRQTIESITRRTGGRRPDLWYVSFYGREENARFSPMELVITSSIGLKLQANRCDSIEHGIW
jgi:hypothetical protein